MRTWSPYQIAVFSNVATGTGHTVVNAVAGSGKTTTIEAAIDHIPAGCSTLFVAFNKSIAEELGRRLSGKPVAVSTLHSYGLRAVTAALGRLRIDGHRVDGFCRALYGDERETFELRRDLGKCVSLAKGALAATAERVDVLIDEFGISSAVNGQRARFITDVLKLLAQCEDVSDGCLDFDDMIWLPVVKNLRQRQFDRVFVDELQDLNAAQIEMVLRAVTVGGRICAVGDPRQAIYQFRGAGDRAFETVRDRLAATELPLSVSYRCSRVVIDHVNQELPEIPIEAAPGAAEGEVRVASREQMMRDAQPGDFVLSRSNAPLIGLCMIFIAEGRRANILGRDIGAQLAVFVKKSKAADIVALRDYVEQWAAKECERLAKKRRDTQAVEDRAACLLALSDGAPSVAAVLARIEELFADKAEQSIIALSTTHKAKGLERDRVWLLAGTYRRYPEVAEDNLYYVAATRAKHTLVLVSGFEKKRRPVDGEGL